MKIAISTTTFGAEDASPIEYLLKRGYRPVMNPHRRPLTGDELIELAGGAVGLIAGTEKITDEVMSRMPGLKVISRCGSGCDNVDAASAKRRGIKVFTTPDAPVESVAELTVGLILGLIRAIPAHDRCVRSGQWKKQAGSLLSGKRAGIVGYGRIGKRVGEFLRAFGCEVVYHDTDRKAGAGDAGSRRVTLAELLSTSDIVTIHASGSAKGAIIDRKAMAAMKRGAYLVNTSRGTAVDEEALKIALADGRIAGSALDVFEKEPYTGSLKGFESVILTQHIGSYAREARIAMELESAKNLVRGLEGTK